LPIVKQGTALKPDPTSRARPGGRGTLPGQVAQRQRTARELDRAQYLEAARRKRGWPGEHLALLGAMPDAEVAERTSRNESAVRVKRCKLGIRSACDRRRRENR
jgi:hypothetical protein